MSKSLCRTCIYGAECRGVYTVCDYYTPEDEYATYDDEYIEGRREEYRRAWEEYVSDDDAPKIFWDVNTII